MTIQQFRLNWHINLDEGEGWSRGEGFVFVLDLVSQVLLHSLLLEHLLLPLGPKQDPRGNGDGDGVLRLRLRIERREEDGWAELRTVDVTLWASARIRCETVECEIYLHACERACLA